MRAVTPVAGALCLAAGARAFTAGTTTGALAGVRAGESSNDVFRT
jgi:hypothetical protein